MGRAETALTRRIVDRLVCRGAYVVKHHGHPYARTGVPDLLVCYRGFFLGLEVKTPDGKLSQRQAHEHHLIAEAGGYSLVARDPQTVDEWCDWIDGRTFS